jgi:hypothetical protein
MTGYITLTVSGRDMSAAGTKLPIQDVRWSVAIEGKADLNLSHRSALPTIDFAHNSGSVSRRDLNLT